MSCTIITSTNGENSQLFKTIEGFSTTEEQAKEYYSHFTDNQDFIESFGDWKADYKQDVFERNMGKRVDENGEPKLFYDNKLKKHYYIDKTDTKEYFPSSQSKLEDIFSKTRIKSISQALALDYFKSRFNDNYNEIDLTKQKGVLRDSIIAKLESKIAEFEESDDIAQMMNADFLQESLLHIDEWVNNVKDYFLGLKLVYKESTETDDIMEEEVTERGQSFGVAAFERSSKENISSNVKLRLSLLINKDELDETLLEPVFHSFDDIHSTLLNYLTDTTALEGEDLFKLMMDTLHQLTDKKPYLLDLYNILQQSDDYVKAEFVQAFNQHRNNFIGSVYEHKTVPIYNKETKTTTTKIVAHHTVQNFSSVGAKHSLVKNNWFYNFTQKYTNEAGFLTKEAKEAFTSIKEIYDNLFLEFNRRANKEDGYDSLTLPVQDFIDILDTLGITTTEDGLNHFLDGLEPGITDFSTRLKNLKKLSTSIKFFLDEITSKEVDLTQGDNIFNKQAAFADLARAQAFYLREGSDSSVFTVNKTKWVYSYPSYISSKIKHWRKNRQLLLDHYNITYNKGSHYMKYLLALEIEESKRKAISNYRLNEFEANIFNSFQKEGEATNAVDNKEISKNDAFADAYHKLLGFRIKGKSSYVQTATPADKGTLVQFKVPDGMMISTNAFMKDGQIEISEAAKEIIFNYIKSEYARINEVATEIKNAKGDESKLTTFYHLGPKNGLKFQLMNSLNIDSFNAEEMGFRLYYKNGNIVQNLNFDEVKIKEGLMNFITKVTNTNIKDTLLHLQDIGLVDRGETGNFINKALDSDVWNSYERNKALNIAADIFINGLISQVEYSKMFAGDIAYYKNIVDYKKRIPATYTDGLQLYLKEGQENFNIAVMDDVNITTPYLKELKELIGEELADQYGEGKIDSTDAQAWITPKRWKFLKQALGKWSKADDTVWDKMQGKNTDPYTKEELKLAAQPLKGVYFDINNGIPVYLKYSQAVLLPSIVNNNEGLRKLYNQMVVQGVDELITGQGIKVGGIKSTLTHNQNGTVADNLSFNVMSLKNSGWKLQQDLPTKTFKNTAVGSQIQKNIFMALAGNLDEMFTVGEKEMTGKELIVHINSIVETLSDKGMSMFENEFEIDTNGKINNLDRLNASLIKELKQRGSSNNVIKALESGLSPFGIPGYQTKLQNVFASITLDRIVKIKTNGGAFIQMSNYGYNSSEADKKGVMWTPWAKETPHEYEYVKDEEGNIIKSESGKKLIRPSGILISGSFIAKYIPDYRKYSQSKLFGTKDKDYKNGVLDRRILENIIGYRIPNQALASNDAVEIVGILPEEGGDTIVAYTGITKKTGSDFDIDKMFVMFPSLNPRYKHKAKLRKYAYNYLRGKTIQDTTDNITKIIDQLSDESIPISAERFAKILLATDNKEMLNFEVDNFVEAVLHTKNELTDYIKKSISDYNTVESLGYVKENDNLKTNSIAGLQNKLIEAYKGALLNESTIKDVMTPIDFEFIKDDILNMFPPSKPADFDTFNLTKEIELKFEFNAGKAGVGITANALVDHIRGLLADTRLFKVYLGAGHSLNEETVLDKEYSQDLDKADIEWLQRNNNKYNKMYSGDEIESLKKIKISHSLSAFLNAFVDIAKDPYVTRGNWTTHTSNTGFMLLRAGIHPFKVNAILAQPIIKEFIDYTINKESIIGNDSGNVADKFMAEKLEKEFENIPDVIIDGKSINFKKLHNTVKSKINQKKVENIFKVKLTEQQYNEIEETYSDIIIEYNAELEEGVVDVFGLTDLHNNLKEADPKFQTKLFFKFLNWQQDSKKVVNSINASKVDTNGYGKDAIEMIIANNLMTKMSDESIGGITNFKSKLTYEGEKTLLGAYSNNILDRVLQIMKSNQDYFLLTNSTLINTFNRISLKIREENLLDKKLGAKIEKSFTSYMMSGFKPFKLSKAEKSKLLRQAVREVAELKKSKNDNLLIQELDIKSASKGRKFLSMNNRKKSPSEQENITNAWLDLFDENRELAERLVQYSYLTSGFQMNMNQFYSYIPFEWFVENDINSYIQELTAEFDKMQHDSDFIAQFFKHNKEDNQIVRRIFPNLIEKKHKTNSAGFVVNDPMINNEFLKKEITNEDTMETSFTLFQRIGNSTEGLSVYKRVPSLGYTDKGNKVFEYDTFNSNVESILAENSVHETVVKRIPMLERLVEDRTIKEQLDEKLDPNETREVEKPTKIPTETEIKSQTSLDFGALEDTDIKDMEGGMDANYIQDLLNDIDCE